ncbi:AraC family transcriptional regulator [Puniceicoccaceae bacterium K14]|nr:AraC family transcriptional regulator [Puniceicoccaceae bacterium K14]
MNELLARGEDYFEDPAYPITVRIVRTETMGQSSHEHDLTEVKHAHDFNELTLVTSGTAIHCLEDEEFPIVAGDVFVLQGQQNHYYRQRDRLEMINVMYEPSQIGLPENRLLKIPGYCALFLLEPVFRKQHRFSSHLSLERIAFSQAERIALEMEREVIEQPDGYEAALLGKLVDLIVFLSRSYQDSKSTNSEALLRVGTVISKMEQDYASDWQLDEFVKLSSLSRSHFMRTFTKATGFPPLEYLIQIRLQKATQLIQMTKLPISQVALEVGFNDSNYFTRQFKKRNGLSPLAYRKAFGNRP